MREQKLISLIEKQKESEFVDFKQEFYHKEATQDLIKDVISFANAQSNEEKYIIFGVSDTYNLFDIAYEKIRDISELNQVIKEYCEPFINVEFYRFIYEEKKLLALIIAKNVDRPYLIKKDYQKNGTVMLRAGDIYIRHGATNFKANRADLDFIYANREKILLIVKDNSIRFINLRHGHKKEQVCCIQVFIDNNSNKSIIIHKGSINWQYDVAIYSIWNAMYLMGTRKGEALALTWQDVDFERQEVRINKSLNRKKPQQGEDIVLAEDPTPSSMGWHVLNSRSYEITTPKNITSNRKVWMTELVVKALKELREESKHDYDFAETDFVFGGKLPLSDQTVRRRMDQYADKAGVKRIRVHDLRHSHASLVISKGLKIEDLILLSKRLGHRDVKETLNTYSHLFPNAQKKILESIDEGAEM